MKKLKQTTALLMIGLAILAFSSVKAQWSFNSTHIYNSNSGFVGIGNSTPTSLLHVSKFMGEPTITVHNPGAGGGATFRMIDNNGNADWKFKALNTGGFKIRDQQSGIDVIKIEQNSMNNSIFIAQGGNIGIGTETPDAAFEIARNGVVPVLSIRNLGGTAAGAEIKLLHDGNLSEWKIKTTNAGGFKIRDQFSGMDVITISQNPMPNSIFIAEGGNTGIGTVLPGGALEIARNDVVPAIILRNLGGTSQGGEIKFIHDGILSEWSLKSTSTGGFKIRDQANSLNVINIEANSAESAIYVAAGGNIGIGTTSPQTKLAVNGEIKCKLIEVTLDNWSDFVFDDDYVLRSLEDVESFIEANNHLPDVPSANEVIENGSDLGEMDAILLRKIEELTLYMIELKKENEELKQRLDTIEE